MRGEAEIERLICNQCGEDFPPIERMCVVVSAPDVFLRGRMITGETICGDCVSKLEITGCRFERWGGHDGGYVVDPLGTSEPPPDWAHSKPSLRDVLEALAGEPFRRVRRPADELAFSGPLKSF